MSHVFMEKGIEFHRDLVKAQLAVRIDTVKFPTTVIHFLTLCNILPRRSSEICSLHFFLSSLILQKIPASVIVVDLQASLV